LLLLTVLGISAAKCPFSNSKVDDSDIAFSKNVQHTGRVSASDESAIAHKINQAIQKMGVSQKDCSDFSHEQLNELMRTMWCHVSSDIGNIFKENDDLRALKYESLAEFEKHWANENIQHNALRDAKCADVLMTFVHHLPASSKKELMQKELHLPLLPTFNKTHAIHPDYGKDYANSFTCVSGHNQTAGHTSDHEWPHWPAEVHYTGLGHGAYPFWLGPSGSGGSAAIEVWWSETKASEKFYHASCGLTEAGYSKDGPCYHLFVGAAPSPQSYLYTAAEDFCCRTSPDGSDDDEGSAQRLSSPQSDFMDAMTLDADYGNITSTFLGNIKAKRYLMTLPASQPVTYFWYIVTEDNLPVQQGEGGHGGSGIAIYHEYNTTSFKATTHDASVFAIPDICKTTTKTCLFP